MKLKSKDDIILELILLVEKHANGMSAQVRHNEYQQKRLQGKIQALKWVLGIEDSEDINESS